MHQFPSRFFQRLLLRLFFACVLGCSTYAYATEALSEPSCLALQTSDSSYLASSAYLVKQPSVSKWVRLIEQNKKRPAFGAHVDKTNFYQGRCYWEISLYEADKEKMTLWNLFLVELSGTRVLKMQTTSGEYKSI